MTKLSSLAITNWVFVQFLRFLCLNIFLFLTEQNQELIVHLLSSFYKLTGAIVMIMLFISPLSGFKVMAD